MTALVAALVLAGADTLPPAGPQLHIDAGCRDNRIRPIEIQVYNDVAFRQRLAGLAQQLAGVLKLDPSQIQGGLFQFQGLKADLSANSFSIAINPLPSVEQVVKQAFDADGKPTAVDPANAGAVKTDQTTRTQAATSPTVPEAKAPTLAFAPPSGVGLDAISRVEEYAELYDRITSLQTVRERATSHIVDINTGLPRIPVVLGIPLSITPSPSDRHLAARVEVKITDLNLETGGGRDVLVSAVVPEKRSYNVAKATASQSAASAGVILGVVNLGGSTFQARQRLYIAKDYDTIAYSAPPAERDSPGTAKFGWWYRPVLGEANVQPGKREALFALSLPPSVDSNGLDNGHQLVVTVTTSWHRYNRGGIDPHPCSTSTYRNVTLISHAMLQPKFNRVELQPGADGSTVEATVYGGSIVASTDLIIGNRLIPGGSYYAAGERTLKFTMSPDEVLNRDVRFVSLFGQAEPLAHTLTNRATQPTSLEGMTARAVEENSNPGFSKLTVRLPGNFRDWLKDQTTKTLIGVGGKIYGLGDADMQIISDGDFTKIEVEVPTKPLLANPVVTLARPFERFSPSVPVRRTIRIDLDGNQGFEVTSAKLAKSGSEADPWDLYTLGGRNMNNLLVRFPFPIGEELRKEIDRRNNGLGATSTEATRLVALPQSVLRTTKTVILHKVDPSRSVVFTREIVVSAPAAPKKVSLSLDPVSVGFRGATTIKGQGFERIAKARCAEVDLKVTEGTPPGGGESAWFVEIPAELTKTAGNCRITFVLDDGSAQIVDLKVNTASALN